MPSQKFKKIGRPRLLIVGCGDVGSRTLALLARHYRVFALTSRPDRCAELRAAGAIPMLGNLDQPTSLRRLRGLARRVLHLAPPPANGLEDPRTRHLLHALSAPVATQPPAAGLQSGKRILPESRFAQRLVYISTSGVYGDCQGEWVAETRPVAPANPRAVRRVAAEQCLRQWGTRLARRVSLLRTPGIYARERLPLARLRKGTPALQATDDVFTNHIHADDLARLAVYALHRARPQRLYHASDDTHLKMGEYFDQVADWARLPKPTRLTKTQAEACLEPTLLSFMRESRRLENDRIKRELGFRFVYPDVAALLKTLAPDSV